MDPGERDIERLERIMASSWRSFEASPGEGWQRNLMRDIRSIAESGEKGKKAGIFNGFAWRLSLAAGAVTLILLVYSLYSGMFTEMDLSMLFFKDPGGFIISPPFG